MVSVQWQHFNLCICAGVCGRHSKLKWGNWTQEAKECFRCFRFKKHSEDERYPNVPCVYQHSLVLVSCLICFVTKMSKDAQACAFHFVSYFIFGLQCGRKHVSIQALIRSVVHLSTTRSLLGSINHARATVRSGDWKFSNFSWNYDWRKAI